jgi:hypothetical protein
LKPFFFETCSPELAWNSKSFCLSLLKCWNYRCIPSHSVLIFNFQKFPQQICNAFLSEGKKNVRAPYLLRPSQEEEKHLAESSPYLLTRAFTQQGQPERLACFLSRGPSAIPVAQWLPQIGRSRQGFRATPHPKRRGFWVCFCFFFFFLWCWGLNLGLCTCKVELYRLSHTSTLERIF